MTSESPSASKAEAWRRIIVHELFEYLLNFLYLAVFLVAFAWYRRLVLASYHIQYRNYWMPVLEAAILAKIIMLGDALRMGRGFRNQPLAVTTVYRAVVYSLFALAFSLCEHVVEAILRGEGAAAGVAEIAKKGFDELAAWYVVILAAFIPFFAMKEIERAFGAEQIRGLFFRRGIRHTGSAASAPSETTVE